LTFRYLDQIQQDFEKQHASRDIDTVERPYAFMRFEPVIQKIKKTYVDTRSTANLKKLNDDLNEIEHIMKTNIAEVLGRGEKLDDLSSKSSRLQADSLRYVSNAKDLNYRLMIRKYAPIAAVLAIILLVLYIRFW
jgi:vesicle transport protein SEC22